MAAASGAAEVQPTADIIHRQHLHEQRLRTCFSLPRNDFPSGPRWRCSACTGLDTYTYRDARRVAMRPPACSLPRDGARHHTAPSSPTTTPGGAAARIWASSGWAQWRFPSTRCTRPVRFRTVLADSGARVLFTTAAYLTTAQDRPEGLTPPPQIVMMGGAVTGLVSLDEPWNSGAPLPACPATRSDPAVILYTSGTTSDPKGVSADPRQPPRRARRRAADHHDRRRRPHPRDPSALSRPGADRQPAHALRPAPGWRIFWRR